MQVFRRKSEGKGSLTPPFTLLMDEDASSKHFSLNDSTPISAHNVDHSQPRSCGTTNTLADVRHMKCEMKEDIGCLLCRRSSTSCYQCEIRTPPAPKNLFVTSSTRMKVSNSNPFAPLAWPWLWVWLVSFLILNPPMTDAKFVEGYLKTAEVRNSFHF